MLKSDYFYSLPPELIATHPLKQRSQSRLMVLNKAGETVEHGFFTDLLEKLQPGDLLVLNNTKVIPARLHGFKETGGKVEILIERVISDTEVLARVSASKTPKLGQFIYCNDSLQIKIGEQQGEFFILTFPSEKTIDQWLEAYGEIPLPPYMARSPEAFDKERYQTVYSQYKGSIAAPTAGLHFDERLLNQLREKGVEIAYVTLHVGSGTFLPMRVDNILEHRMHHEWVDIPEATCTAILQAKARNSKVIAVGTTSVRSLEYAAHSGQLKPYRGETNLFIYPGFRFNIIDGMITNFHLPESTLIMLVCAFAGKAFVLQAYQEAVKKQYRFFSYGDAMLII